MVLKRVDGDQVPTILALEQNEMEDWRKLYGAVRKREMLPPDAYIDDAVAQLGGLEGIKRLADDTTALIYTIRETAWNIYIEHEQLVCGHAMTVLLEDNVEARAILKAIVDRVGLDPFATTDKNALVQTLSEIIGEVNGRAFPYVYELAKSVTQSRRSRAGKSFEKIIRWIIDAKGFPCDDQSKAGTEKFKALGLGKIVDGLLPSIQAYNDNRAKCAIITMKTTLRERWQEVVEELHRTNVPHIYLLTLDDAVNASNLGTMKNHNITLVVPKHVQESNPDFRNLMSFEKLFNTELPHLLKYWE